MYSSLSLLQRATPSDVRRTPFPYILLQDALPADLYSALASTFPTVSELGIDDARNNARWNVVNKNVQEHPTITRLWKEFVAYHASQQFYLDIVRLFYPAIHELYPKQFPNLAYAENLRVGTRRIDTFADRDILMDAMISGNTPVRSASSVRTTHVDQGRKLFSGLFYMRRDEDDSTGGDLTISRFKSSHADVASRAALFKGAYVSDDSVDIVETVPYGRNVLILFINSIDSLHGVTVRQPTKHGRYFVNLIGESVAPLYRFRKGRPHYVKLAWPMDMPVPPASIVGRRLLAWTGAAKTSD